MSPARDLTRAEMEARRLAAIPRFRAGVSPAQVARELGVARASAGRWRKRIEAGDSLVRRPTPGRPPRLTAEQRGQLHTILHSRRWTHRAFAEEIRRRFGVVYDEDHVGRLMHCLGVPVRGRQRAASNGGRCG